VPRLLRPGIELTESCPDPVQRPGLTTGRPFAAEEELGLLFVFLRKLV